MNSPQATFFCCFVLFFRQKHKSKTVSPSILLKRKPYQLQRGEARCPYGCGFVAGSAASYDHRTSRFAIFFPGQQQHSSIFLVFFNNFRISIFLLFLAVCMCAPACVCKRTFSVFLREIEKLLAPEEHPTSFPTPVATRSFITCLCAMYVDYRQRTHRHTPPPPFASHHKTYKRWASWQQ